MRILICYASTEGQTRKICRFCADRLFERGHNVELLEAAGTRSPAPDCDAAILAGSVHLGRVQAELADFATDNATALNAIPTLFFLVSLSAAGTDPDERADLNRIAQDFCDRAGWRPRQVHHLAGAFRFTRYDVFRSWAMRWIAARKGQKVDPRADREYTDWDGLSRLLQGWPEAAAAKGG